MHFRTQIRFNSQHPLKTSCCHWAQYKTRSITSYACRSGECLDLTCVSFCKGTRGSGIWALRRTRASNAQPSWSSSCRLCRNSCRGTSPSDNSDNPPSAHLENKRIQEYPIREYCLQTRLRLFFANSCITCGQRREDSSTMSRIQLDVYSFISRSLVCPKGNTCRVKQKK